MQLVGREWLLACHYDGINNTIREDAMQKRAGRPEKAASERRSSIFRFVVTRAEAVVIRKKAKAAGLSISEYLRSAALR